MRSFCLGSLKRSCYLSPSVVSHINKLKFLQDWICFSRINDAFGGLKRDNVRLNTSVPQVHLVVEEITEIIKPQNDINAQWIYGKFHYFF
jgi:hypothetical protein